MAWTRTGQGAAVQTFGYDGRDQLTSATVDGTTTTYVYDGAQNRVSTAVSGGGPTESYSVNSNDQVTQVIDSVEGTTTFGYDGAGNQTSKTLGAQTDTYAYDAENRLTVAVVGGVSTSMVYDPFGRRVTFSSGGSTTNYAYDQLGNPLVELDASGIVQAVYALEPGILDRPVAQLRAGTTYCYHQDHLGSVWGITDPNQTLVRGYDYTPTGGMASSSGTLANVYTYTGRQWDLALSLYHYRMRQLDPATGRFLSRDPLTKTVMSNTYAYVVNAPVTYTDPMGLVRQREVAGWETQLFGRGYGRFYGQGGYGTPLRMKHFPNAGPAVQNAAQNLEWDKFFAGWIVGTANPLLNKWADTFPEYGDLVTDDDGNVIGSEYGDSEPIKDWCDIIPGCDRNGGNDGAEAPPNSGDDGWQAPPNGGGEGCGEVP